MHMQVPVVVEYDAESGHDVATVPGLPNIVVDATSEAEVLKLAREAILFYLEETGQSAIPANLSAKVAMVEV